MEELYYEICASGVNAEIIFEMTFSQNNLKTGWLFFLNVYHVF